MRNQILETIKKILTTLLKISEEIFSERGINEEIYIKAMLALIQTYESCKDVTYYVS